MTISSMALRNLPYRPASFSVQQVTVYVMSQKLRSKQISVEKLGVFSMWMMDTNLAAKVASLQPEITHESVKKKMYNLSMRNADTEKPYENKYERLETLKFEEKLFYV